MAEDCDVKRRLSQKGRQLLNDLTDTPSLAPEARGDAQKRGLPPATRRSPKPQIAIAPVDTSPAFVDEEPMSPIVRFFNALAPDAISALSDGSKSNADSGSSGVRGGDKTRAEPRIAKLPSACMPANSAGAELAGQTGAMGTSMANFVSSLFSGTGDKGEGEGESEGEGEGESESEGEGEGDERGNGTGDRGSHKHQNHDSANHVRSLETGCSNSTINVSVCVPLSDSDSDGPAGETDDGDSGHSDSTSDGACVHADGGANDDMPMPASAVMASAPQAQEEYDRRRWMVPNDAAGAADEIAFSDLSSSSEDDEAGFNNWHVHRRLRRGGDGYGVESCEGMLDRDAASGGGGVRNGDYGDGDEDDSSACSERSDASESSDDSAQGGQAQSIGERLMSEAKRLGRRLSSEIDTISQEAQLHTLTAQAQLVTEAPPPTAVAGFGTVLTQHNIELGCAVHPGPHWLRPDADANADANGGNDGANDLLGHVVAFRKATGPVVVWWKVDIDCSAVRPLCAVVRWREVASSSPYASGEAALVRRTSCKTTMSTHCIGEGNRFELAIAEE